MFNFEDNIGLLILKMISQKATPVGVEIFNSDSLEQSSGAKCSILKIT